MSEARRASGGRPPAGFTLIEVLGAVAVLAILYTVLAGVAIQAFRAEGESRRRMEASLLAGERLADLEASSALGIAPPPGEETEEVDIFSITTRVRSLQAGEVDLGSDTGDETGAELLFASPNTSDEASLREIEILVTWSEGDRDMEVRRATYALDTSTLAGLFGGGGGTRGSDVLDLDGDALGIGRGGGSGRSGSGSGGGTADCTTPCPAEDVECLIMQFIQCQ